jgi:hypothetical protein
MRRILATLIVTAVLTSSAPSLARRDDGDRFNPIEYIKKIVRILIPAPADDGGTATPPKP